MTIDLSFTQDPTWRTEREVLWQRIEPILNDGYTRKELAMVKAYYFDGTLDEKGIKRLYDADKILHFPLRSPEGWAYVMRYQMKGWSDLDELGKARRGYDSILNSLLTYAMREIGDDWHFDEQCALFDWLVGEHYQAEIASPVPIGPQEQVTCLKLVPDDLYNSAVCGLKNWLISEEEEEYRYNLPVWIARLDYLFELLPLVDERVFDVDIHKMNVRKASGGRIDFDQKCLQMILKYMKSYPPQAVPAEELAKRKAFLMEFRRRLEALDHKPGQLQQQLDNLNS